MRALAIAARFTGVVVIAATPIEAVGPDNVAALLLASVAAASMANAAILMRRLQGVGTSTLQAWIALSATVSLGLITLLLEDPSLAKGQRAGYARPRDGRLAQRLIGL